MPRLLNQVSQGVSFEEGLEKEFKSSAQRLEKDWKRWLPRFFQPGMITSLTQAAVLGRQLGNVRGIGAQFEKQFRRTRVGA